MAKIDIITPDELNKYIRSVDGRITSITLRNAALEKRIAALEADTTPEPPPANTYLARTPEELSYRLSQQKPGETVMLDSMTFAFPLDITANDYSVKAADGTTVLCTAMVPLTAAFTEDSPGIWRADYTHSLDTHPATNEGPWQGHRDRMRPEQFVINKKLFEAVYSRADLTPGTFYVDGPSSSPKAVFIGMKTGEVIETAHYARYPRLLFSSTGATGVTIEGIEFKGAASTGKRGAVQTGDGWTLRNVKCSYSAGPGFEVTGSDVELEYCLGEHNGQLNYLVFSVNGCNIYDCNSASGNRKGFNAAWEAGGMKVIDSTNVRFIGYDSASDDGPGLWFDVGNYDVVVEWAVVNNSLAAGIMFEHGFRGRAKDLYVNTVRAYLVPAQTNTRQDGIVWQSRVWDSTFEDMRVSGCNNAFVFKEHEGRGASGRNTLRNGEVQNVSRGLYIERMNGDEIAAAIARGAMPATAAQWAPSALGNVFENIM